MSYNFSMKNLKKQNDALVFQNAFYDTETGVPTSPIITESFILIQAADSYYLKEATIDEHTQSCDIEFTYVTYGSVSSYSGNVCERVDGGEIYISFLGDEHRIKGERRCRFQTLAFNVKESSSIRNALEVLKELLSEKKSRKLSGLDIATAITHALDEFYCDGMPFKAEALDSIMSSVLISSVRAAQGEKRTRSADKELLLPSLINRLDEDYLSIRSLCDIKEEYNYSRSYLSRSFKQLNGVTMKDYLTDKKMTHAKELLERGRSVKDISAILGYSTPYNFTRAFKDKLGISPKEYKEKAKREAML